MATSRYPDVSFQIHLAREMSDVSSELGAEGRTRTVSELASRLLRKASSERLSLASHLSVGRLLCKLRDAIVAGETVVRPDAMKILCAGIAFYRRHTLGDVQEDEEDSSETIELLRQSATLIFVLLAAVEARSNGLSDTDNSSAIVEAANQGTLAAVLDLPSRKRPRTDQAPDEQIVTPGELTLNVLKLAACALSRPTSPSELHAHADVFFRASAACMASRILLKEGNVDFKALSTQKNDSPREKRLLAIAQAGESEAGQSCLRDILLSFLLPAKMVGVRRTLLLSRAAGTAAGVDHPDLVNQAHSVAMAATEWIWKHGTSELERACALLAGVAVLITRGGDDPMRKQDAFLGRSKKKMLPCKRRRVVVVPKAEPSADAKLRSLHKLVKEVDQWGVRPKTPTQLFIIIGVNSYSIHEENLVSLAKDAASRRRPLGRRRLTINAGTPTSRNPRAGAWFQKLSQGFLPTDCELHEKCYYEPKPLNFELAQHPYCSEADVLARYVGWKALLNKGPFHFLVYFLNQGDLNLLDTPVDDEEFAPFQAQRNRIEANLRKLVLVYPERVEAELDDSKPVVAGVQTDLPYTVACFASILSDKREGTPGASSGTSIGGYHEKCRLWPLALNVLEKIRQVMDHFGIDMPELRNPLAGTLNLEDVRKKAMVDIGYPTQLTEDLKLDAAWLERRATMPFCKPWVQICNFHHPNGKVDEDNQPELVPLYKGCAEERNGHCWLNPDALNPTLPHGQHVHETMSALIGRAYKRPSVHTEAVVNELQETLVSVRQDLGAWRAKYDALHRKLEAVNEVHEELVEKHKKAEKTLNVSVSSRFSDTPTCGYRVVVGGVDARVSIVRKARGTLQLTKPNGECIATWPDEFGDKLLLRFTRSSQSGDSESE